MRYIYQNYISDENGVVRMILSTTDDGETMVVYTPRSRLVTIVRNDPQKGMMMTKRMGVKINRWKVFVNHIDSFISNAEDIEDDKELDIEYHIGGGVHITMNNSFPFLQFREFYREKTGEAKAGRKGIKLLFEELRELKCHADAFNKCIAGYEEIPVCQEMEGHDEVACKECNFK